MLVSVVVKNYGYVHGCASIRHQGPCFRLMIFFRSLSPARRLSALLVFGLAACSGAWALAVRPPSGMALAEQTTTTANADSGLAVGVAWPLVESPLHIGKLNIPAGFGIRRLWIDPGHGAPNNPGNLSALCEWEQDFTLRLAEHVQRYLEETGHFEIARSRYSSELVPYADRVTMARDWQAELFLSLHSDIRGNPDSSQVRPGCIQSSQSPGFSVLWSDVGNDPLVQARHKWALALASEMEQVGFFPFRRSEYGGVYQPDDRQPGVFLDRHLPARRIYLLHQPSMPSLLVETHNARDISEAKKWQESQTIQAFSMAIVRSIVRYLALDAPVLSR
jgi:N-acetylmuramoyl-L-alanine amidase